MHLCVNVCSLLGTLHVVLSSLAFYCVIDVIPLSLGVDLKVKDIIVDGKTYTVRLW